MTPGISHKMSSVSDQKYKTMKDVDTDFLLLVDHYMIPKT